MIKIVIQIKICRSLKSVLPEFKDPNVSILSLITTCGKGSSVSTQCRNFLVSWKPISFSAITLPTEADTWIQRNTPWWETTYSIPITCAHNCYQCSVSKLWYIFWHSAVSPSQLFPIKLIQTAKVTFFFIYKVVLVNKHICSN